MEIGAPHLNDQLPRSLLQLQKININLKTTKIHHAVTSSLYFFVTLVASTTIVVPTV